MAERSGRSLAPRPAGGRGASRSSWARVLACARPNALRELAQGLSAVATRLEPRAATQAAATLAGAMVKMTRPDDQYQLARGLPAVTARMEPQEATRLCA